VSSGLPAWNKDFAKTVSDLTASQAFPATGYSECAQTRELPGAFLCQSSTQRVMNLAFARASIFAEGGFGYSHGTVLKQSDPALAKAYAMIAGNDLKSVDLLEFYAKAAGGCEADTELCLNSQEKEVFAELILPLADKGASFAVITYAAPKPADLITGNSYRDTVSHEILHAQYFLQPAYEEAATRFWTQALTEKDRAQVKKQLSMYDVDNDYVMRNEFQAYILMAGANKSLLKALVPKFREPLMKAMNDAGTPPIQVTGRGAGAARYTHGLPGSRFRAASP
jgi:hypothetical protein